MIKLQNIEQLYEIFKIHQSVQTDTRKLKNGDIFFALKGPNFNGNLYAIKALELGASFAIVDEIIEGEEQNIFLCHDVLQTLQNLALYHRKQFNIPFIAITGSNGKTTTKELVYSVLSSHFKTYTTQGNLNNHIGVPLTILSVKKDAQIAVIEMGANHQKEIESYCQYTLPTHGIITNCGKAHLEGFGGVEGVKKGKGELYDFLKQNNGTVFLFSDYDYLKNMSIGINKIVSYGTKDGLVQGEIITSNPFLKVAITNTSDKEIISTNLVGDYNLSNVLTAVAIGKYFDVPFTKIKLAIENYLPTNSRSQLVKWNTNTVIVDAYNANPSSMKVAIENFAKQDFNHKVLLLGAMMEMGEESITEHEQLIQLIKQYNWKSVVLVGGDFEKINHNFFFFKTSTEAAIWFNNQNFENTAILVKGSRGTQMEKVLPQGLI
jgi:UDP-N-acetylmuramoyl-tripeptide--D-alanyl-D-alanine ligase